MIVLALLSAEYLGCRPGLWSGQVRSQLDGNLDDICSGLDCQVTFLWPGLGLNYQII